MNLLIRSSQHPQPSKDPPQLTHATEGRRQLEHVTDAFIEAWGPSFERALAQAGLGFFETMIDLSSVDTTLTVDLRFEGHDELELVYNWLEELLLKFEVNNIVLARFDIGKVTKTSTGLEATATAQGEAYSPRKHGAKVGVKGVTYHQMMVKRDPGRVTLTYLLDL